MTRVAAVDCGTNSIRLLVADVENGELSDLDRRMEIVRLGQGVDRTGRIAPEALRRTLAALEVYARRIRELDASRVRMVATSATRDAANRGDFVEGVVTTLGVEPEVISGAEEAALSYDGATRELRYGNAQAPYLVVDIGGGSTEFVLGNDDGVIAARSVDIGCVRMTERRFASDPPTATEIDAAANDVALERARTVCAVAGTATTVAGMALGLPAYDAAAIHRARVKVGEVRRISDELLAMTHEQRAAIPVMHPGRVDVIAAGALVLRAVVERANVDEIVASEHDILDGIAWSLA
ncbi:MAG TPA: Ppx/GppA phosphatase family protein [Actinomycetes bacterium]|nr:Ppx/GppA phosphatase family protein [Actinomycetes bacterium]